MLKAMEIERGRDAINSCNGRSTTNEGRHRFWVIKIICKCRFTQFESIRKDLEDETQKDSILLEFGNMCWNLEIIVNN